MADWKENVVPGEDELFERIAKELRALQAARIAKSGKKRRALHAKQHVGAQMELVVGDVPDGMRVGPFADRKTWKGYVRFSNGSPARQPDKRIDVRGIALKIVGVPGKKLIPGLEDKLTQDFLLIHTQALPIRDPQGFFHLQRALMGSPLLLLPKLASSLGLRETLYTMARLARTPMVKSMATTRFHTAAPIRIGDVAVKLDLVPLTNDGPRGGGKDGLREDLIARLQAGPLQWTLRAQKFVDDKTTPIEDASIQWEGPFVELARVIVPQQDVTSTTGEKIHDFVESLSFDPWHATDELRPLGGIMRARKAAYRESVLERGAAAEPDGTESF